ncbi:MAG: hypothetical protein ACI854_001694 [Arenicella sp.]|jgi:hypothetical protein
MSTGQKMIRIALLSVLFFSWPSMAEVTVSSNSNAKQWFVNNYAVVWQNTQSLNIKALVPLYHSQGFVRNGQQLILWQQPESSEQLLQELTRQQWLGSKVLSIQSQKITATSQSLNVVWQSEYKTKNSQISCEWYLLENLQSQWKVIEQRYTEC